MSDIIDKIVGVVVGILLIGYVGSNALVGIANATGMTGVTHTIFSTVLPILGVIALLVIITSYYKR